MEATMILDRRKFLLSSGSALAVAAVAAPSTILIEGCNTNWVNTVINDIPTVVNIVDTIIAVVAQSTGNGVLDAAAVAIVTDAANSLHGALLAFQDAVNAYEKNKSQGNLAAVISALQAAQNDTSNFLKTLPTGLLSSSVATIIVAALGTTITVLSAIESLIPGAAPVSITAKSTVAAVSTKPSMPNSATLAFGFNSVLMLHGFASAQIKAR